MVDTACGGIVWRGTCDYNATEQELKLLYSFKDNDEFISWTFDCQYMIVGRNGSYKIIITNVINIY